MAEVPEFKDAVMIAISEEQTFTSSLNSIESSNCILGGIAISKKTNSIEWLVVSASARGLGIGRQLLKAALKKLDSASPISDQCCFDSADGLYR